MAVIARFNQGSVLSGYNAWAQGLEKAISRYYQIDIHLVIDNVNTAENMLFYGVVLGLLMLIINYATAAMRSNKITILLTGLALVMSLMLDDFPGYDMDVCGDHYLGLVSLPLILLMFMY